MACGATLKRTLDFDPLHSPSPSPKRRRCVPLIPPTTPQTKAHQLEPSPFGHVSPKLTPEQLSNNVMLEWRRMQRRKKLSTAFTNSSSTSTSASHIQSPIAQASTSSASSTPSTSSLGQHVQLLSSLSPSVSSCVSPSSSPSRREQPIFTLRQVIMLCERLLKEREEQIREEYDKTLTCKLAEQYEAFLKFNHDQLHRRFGETAASYVS
ncbi:akirin-2-like [Ptychodera flava]|uniref:akirin-2-like n=1 Tax=Ptychodera flava TaxID=63121 RepID=UPI00396A47BA